MTLRDILYIVFKRKYKILMFFLITFSLVALGTFLKKPIFEAKSQILVKIGRENVYVPARDSLSPVVSLDQEKQINSEIEILKSNLMAEKLLSVLGPDTVYKTSPDSHLESFKVRFTKWLNNLKGIFLKSQKTLSPLEKKEAHFKAALMKFRQNLKVINVENTNIIDITFRHENSQKAANMLNTHINIYMDHHLQVHKAPQTNRFFQQQAEYLKDKLDRAEEMLKALKKDFKITSIGEQQGILLKQTAELRSNLNRTLSLRVETRNRIKELKQQLAVTPEFIDQGREVHHDAALIGTLESRLVELQLKEKKLLSKYTENSRLVQNVREEILMVQEKLSEQQGKQYPKSLSGINPTFQHLHKELLRNEAELKALGAKMKTLRKQVADYESELEKLNQIEGQIKQLQQQIAIDQENYKLYLKRLEESRISDAMDREKITNVSLIEPAQKPQKPVSPKVTLNLMIGIFIGLFGGIGLGFFLDHIDDSFDRPDDLEKYLQAPVLASIPKLKL